MGQITRSGMPASTQLSEALWGGFDFRGRQSAIIPGGGPKTRFAMDDFMGFGKATAVSSNLGRYASAAGCYQSWEDTGGSIANLPTVTGGGIRLTNDTTDNDEVNMQLGDITGVLGAISVTAGNDGCQPTRFETSFRLPTQVTSGTVFMGMAQEGLAVENFLPDTDNTFADKDFIGFYVSVDAPTTLKFCYHKESGTRVDVSIGTIAVDTWYKAGWLFVPAGFQGADADKRIRIFLDGAEYTTTYITATQASSTTHFPGDEEMSPMFSAKNTTTAARLLDLRWWAWGQENAA